MFSLCFRRKRMAEMKEKLNLSKFGEVKEITKADWIQEVNKAGDGVWVIIHVYKQGSVVKTSVFINIIIIYDYFNSCLIFKTLSHIFLSILSLVHNILIGPIKVLYLLG